MGVIGKTEVGDLSAAEAFTEFVRSHEGRLRQSLSGLLGSDRGREAAAEALAYGWENWDRVNAMDNPVGYLYKVGRDRGRKGLLRQDPVFTEPDYGRIPSVEPGLTRALARLPERQRVAVTLIHCFQWTLSEVAEVLGIAKATVQTHADRGLASLRREMGVESG